MAHGGHRWKETAVSSGESLHDISVHLSHIVNVVCKIILVSAWIVTKKRFYFVVLHKGKFYGVNLSWLIKFVCWSENI